LNAIPPETEGKRKFGYSHDKRFDCVQVVIALIVIPEGVPLAYEVMSGNTSDKTTLADFLKKIEARYGKAHRIWVMDRGIPTEETPAQMRTSELPVYYLVGTPRGRLSKLEHAFLPLPWEQVRDSVEVKLLDQAGELYLLAKSAGRAQEECSMRRRRLKKRLKRLHELQHQRLTRDELLLKLGAAKKEAGRAYALVDIQVPEKTPAVTPERFTFSLNRSKLHVARRREGHYLWPFNLTGQDPAQLWQYYL
jgi:transposase